LALVVAATMLPARSAMPVGSILGHRACHMKTSTFADLSSQDTPLQVGPPA